MHASSPLPSPPLPGSGASPTSASPSPATAAGGHRLLAAHARLAAIDPWSGRERLFDEILASLLLGSGASRGALLDPAQPARSVAAGLTPPAGLLAAWPGASRPLRARSSPCRGPISHRSSATSGHPSRSPSPPRTRRSLSSILDGPPEDPAGFASATAHAAWLLDTVRMAEKVQKADFELKYRVWELQSLYDVGLSIARTLDLESLAEDILMKSVSLLNARSGSSLVRAQGDEGFFAKHVGEPLLDADAIYEVPAEAVLANLRESRPAFLEDAPAEKLLPVPDRRREPRARRPRRRRQGEARGRRRRLHRGRRARREPLREPGRDRARERAPPPRGRREGEDGARDGARRLHPEDDSSRRPPGRRGTRPRGRKPADEAGRRRLLRRLPAARTAARRCASRTSRARACRRRSSFRRCTRASIS